MAVRSALIQRCVRAAGGPKGGGLVTAYLFSTAKPLYLAGQCVLCQSLWELMHTLPPFGPVELGGFSRVPAEGFSLQFLN